MWWHRSSGVCLFVVLGCSSSSPSAVTSSPDAKVDAGDGADPKPYDQVLASCTSFAAKLCADSSDCCTIAYGAYDAAACVASFQDQVCQPAADAVQNGFATYDESAVEPCLAAHAQANSLCIPDWGRLLELRKALWSACKVVRGTTEAGRGCTTSVTCAEPEGAKTANCVTGTCRVLEILPEGAACPFQSGAVSICDHGLYCSATQDAPGVCTPALSLGAACSGILTDPSCGFGNYCDSVDKICKPTVNFGGPSCKQGLECVSFDCDRTTSVCAPAPAVVTEAQCLGSAGGL